MSKCLVIGDLHFGEKGNSEKFNKQLLDFLRWVVENFKDKVDTVVQLGDFFHHRKKIQLDTLNYGIEGAKILGDAFGKENVFVLAGNHDLFYLNRLDVSSIAAIAPYVTVVDSLTPVGKDQNTIMCPWIATQEAWDDLISISDQYKFCLGHFELNGFFMNESYKMEHGFSPNGLKKFDKVISGHYHSPQEDKNIVYIGTPLPITMSEANEDHGVGILDTETGELEFIEYSKVKVISVPFDQLEDIIDSLDPENTTIRVEFPDDLEDETVITDVREVLESLKFSDTKVKYTGKKAQQILSSEVEDIGEIDNIDEAVLSFIKNSTEVSGVDKELLVNLYLEAKENSIGVQE